MASSALPETLALQRLYHWEKTSPDKIVFTQPMGGGVVKDYTWKQALDETRRMAAYLKSLNYRAGHAHRAAGQEHRALDDGRLGHLDGRPRVGAAVPDAGGEHGAPDPRAQRVASCCSSASSTCGRR